MKQVLMSTLVLGVAIGSFANPAKEGAESAFFGKIQNTRTKPPKYTNKNTLKGKQNTFFISYKVLGADISNNNEAVAADQQGDITSVDQIRNDIYFDWGLTLGHCGTIGFNFDDNFFSMFADLCYIKHSKDHEYVPVGGSDDRFVIDTSELPYLIWDASDTSIGVVSPFIVNGRNTLWKGGVFISYRSYTHSRFFLMPYAGPHVLSQRTHLLGTLVEASDPSKTEEIEYLKKTRGFGPLVGTTGKFYFNKDVFVFGDLRLAGHFVRTKSFVKNISMPDNPNTKSTVHQFGLFVQEGVGLGFEKIRNDFRFDFLISYEAFHQFLVPVTYHTLGVTVTLGF